ncbi:Coa1p TDEL_0F05540 [Torulaspora delbrueckii]|uniref:Uncharacterized protein n=1 Tax=Torulaspora delbrueckii TaxID=4950 RepID=G8ZXM1_TORDE|nr:hypothetical protein TDEL_0F05540 [Torulaspora delbrueckii]CCE93365.1 hypothetical protein TDEL_0F05540 [Torulaspora delbrueckii]
MLKRSLGLLVGRSVRSYYASRVIYNAPKLVLKDKNRPLRIDRELPDPNEGKLKQRLQLAGFSVAIVAALMVIFNYEKTESPVVSNTLYHLRRSPATAQLLGENIEFEGLVPWVHGELNQVAGKVNIRFNIKGDKNAGVVRLIADRETPLDEFLIHEWSLTVNGNKIDLLSEEGVKTL